MGLCYFCEMPNKDRESYYQYYCAECKKLQRILKLYKEDVYDVCDKVFIRDKKQQDYKIKTIDTSKVNNSIEDEKHDYNLRRNGNKKLLKNND